MKRVWHTSSKILAGLFLAAIYAMPQGYTISARPGAVNYIEGHAFLDGTEISQKTLGKTFLNTNDKLSTDIGKAEVLLTPGVFLRIGNNSEVRMVSPSLTNTQVEVTKGEAIVEVADLGKDNNIEILDRGGSMRIEKTGLYRVTADDPPTAAVLEGKAELNYGDRKVELGKGHEAVITADLKSQKFNSKAEDDLYAWSNVRSEYDAGASYAAARSVATNSYNNYGGWGYPDYGLGYGGLGYGGQGYGFGGPGWYYNGLWDSWAWMPGNGYFFSPFGWGFYSPAYIGYAPVVYAPVGGRTAPVPVNTKKPPAIAAAGAAVPRSPAALNAARAQTARSFATAQARESGGRMSAPASAGHVGGFSAPSAAPSAGMSAGAHSGGGSHR